MLCLLSLLLHQFFDRGKNIYKDVGTEHRQCQQEESRPAHSR